VSFEDVLNEYLNNKEIINLREINYGEYKLTGYKSPYFNYEILLPYHYIMNYSGNNGVKYFKSRTEISDYAIKDKSFTGFIFVTKIGEMKVLDQEIDLGLISDRDEAIEIYKKLIANSTLMTIHMKGDVIENVYVDYLVYNNKAIEPRRASLMSEKYPYKEFLLKENY